MATESPKGYPLGSFYTVEGTDLHVAPVVHVETNFKRVDGAYECTMCKHREDFSHHEAARSRILKNASQVNLNRKDQIIGRALMQIDALIEYARQRAIEHGKSHERWRNLKREE